jgi:hypothetical protein
MMKILTFARDYSLDFVNRKWFNLKDTIDKYLIGSYRPGFSYRFRFRNAAPWESPHFSGSEDIEHVRYRPMVDFVCQKTGLPLTEVVVQAD